MGSTMVIKGTEMAYLFLTLVATIKELGKMISFLDMEDSSKQTASMKETFEMEKHMERVYTKMLNEIIMESGETTKEMDSGKRSSRLVKKESLLGCSSTINMKEGGS